MAAEHRNGLGPSSSYAGWVLDLDVIDVEEIATALADQTDYEHRWLIDPSNWRGGLLDQRHGHRR